MFCDICNTKEADVKVSVTNLDGEYINTCVICPECAKTFSLKVEDLKYL